jgi:hypothetical protein
VLVAVLIVLGVVLTPIAGLAVWLHNTLLDADQYAATVGPLADDPDVQQAIANRVTNVVIEGTDLQTRISDALPDRATFIAPFVVDGAEQVVRDVTLRIVESEQFRDLWKTVNERAHARVVALLQGKGRGNIETENGQVAVEVGPIVDRVVERLDDLGISAFGDLEADDGSRRIVLINSEQLKKAQNAVDLLDRLAVVLPILAISCLVVGVALSGNRRRSVLRASLGIAFAMALLLTALNVGRSFYLNALPASVNRAAAESVYDQLVVFLRTGLRALFALAVIVAIGAWVMGPSRLAVSIREGVRKVGARPTTAGAQPSRVATFVGDARVVLRVLVVGLGLVILVALDHPGPIAVLVITLLVVALLLLVEFLARGARPVTAE